MKKKKKRKKPSSTFEDHTLYRGTSLTRKCTPLGPYRRPMPRVLGGRRRSGRAPGVASDSSEVPMYMNLYQI